MDHTVLREMMEISEEQAAGDADKQDQGNAHVRWMVLVAGLRAHLPGREVRRTVL